MQPEIPAELNVATYFLDRHVNEGRSGRISIRGEPQAYTYEELAELASGVGNALAALGLEAGDRVLMLLPDSIEFVGEHLPGHKVPAWVIFVTELPKTATGKIQRYKLRRQSR